MMAPRRLASRPAGAAYDVRRVLDWSADGTVVAMQDDDGGVAVVALDEWRFVHRVGRAHHARFVPGGSVLAFAERDAVHLVDMADGWTRRSVPARSVRALALSADGTLLAVGGGREIVVWRLEGAAARRLYAVPHESAFGLQLAVDAERLVAYVEPDPAGGAEQCRVWSARDPAAGPVASELPALSVGLEQPRRAALVADGATLVLTGRGKGGRAELVIIDVMSQRLHRRLVVGNQGYCGHVVATPDGARIVVEVGEANAPQRLVVVDGFGAEVKQIARVEWGLGGLWLAPDGASVIYEVGSDLWRLDLRAAVRTPVLRLAPPRAVSAAALPAMGMIGVPSVPATPTQTQTRAVLVAGRVIDSHLPRWGQVAELRALVARRADGLCVVVAGDEVEYQPGDHAPDEQVHARVVIGYPVADADADLGPRGPVEVAEVRAALARAAQLDAFFWRKVSAILARTPTPFTAAQRRRSLSGASAGWFADVALDAAELLVTRDVVHLVPTGPLAHASLVAGMPGPMPPDEGTTPEELQLWHHGQDSRQAAHTVGVRGQLVACADAHGLGTDRVELESQAVAAQLAAPGAGLYLIARYD